MKKRVRFLKNLKLSFLLCSHGFLFLQNKKYKNKSPIERKDATGVIF